MQSAIDPRRRPVSLKIHAAWLAEVVPNSTGSPRTCPTTRERVDEETSVEVNHFRFLRTRAVAWRSARMFRAHAFALA